MGAHARLSMSKIKQAKGCPASVRAQEGYPEQETRANREGTAVHWMIEEVLLDHFGSHDRARIEPRHPMDLVGAVAPNGVKLTAKNGRDAEVYVDEVMSHADGADLILIEAKLSHLKRVDPDLGGTSDTIIYSFASRTLYVIDYKNGRMAVDPVENDQCLGYGLGAYLLPEMRGKPIDRVVIIIVQPNRDGGGPAVMPWETEPLRLMEFAAELKELGPKTRDPNAPRIAGSHCTFCKDIPNCKPKYELALASAGLTPVDFFSDVIPRVEAAGRLSNDEMALRLQQAEHLERWIKSVKVEGLRRALEGMAPTGFKAVAGRGSRKFKDPAAAVETLALELGIPKSALYDSEPKSVAEVENVIGKKELKSFGFVTDGGQTVSWSELFTMKPGGPKLVPLSDKGTAITKADGFDVVSDFDLTSIDSD